MKAIVMTLTTAAVLGFGACESETCYQCEGWLGLENECCGDKDKCELFRKDCDANGGKIIIGGKDQNRD